MAEYLGKINLPKDTMLFVVNEIFEKNIKESTSKENILKMIPEIYTEENLSKLLKMISYEGYMALEKLIEFTKKSDDIEKFEKDVEYRGFRSLEEAMIVVVRAKGAKYIYSLNPNVIEKLSPLFSDVNRKIAKRYDEMEKLTQGILYTYGVVEFETFKKMISKYMAEIISEEELIDLFNVRLDLNLFVSLFSVEWHDNYENEFFVTYLDEETTDYNYIATQQKLRGLKYKPFSKKEILSREKNIWGEGEQALYEFIGKNNEKYFKHILIRLLKANEEGADIMRELFNLCRLKNEDEQGQFANLFMEWYNNSPQYVLGGYSPNEMRRKYMG